jgi:hypothetical protein
MAGAVAVLAAMGGLGASAQAEASSAGWYQVYQVNTSGAFTGIATVSRTNVWMVGDAWNSKGGFVYRPLIRHFEGRSWKTVTIPGSPRFESVGVSASAADNVWVFGQTSTAGTVMYRYDGSHWRKIPMLADSSLSGPAVVLGPRNVWAIGSCADVFVRGCGLSDTVFHWNGSRWQGYSLDHGDVGAWSISASAASNIWIAGTEQRSKAQREVAYRWTGNRWRDAGMPAVRIADTVVPVVTAFSPGNVWVGWDFDDVVHWNGHHWQTLTTPADLGPDTSNIVPDGKGGYWFGYSVILTGNTWTSEPPGEIATGSVGNVVRIPGTESFLLPGCAENSSFTTCRPTLYRFDL